MKIDVRASAERTHQEQAAGSWQGRFVDEYVTQTARRTPERVAVVDGIAALSYLDAESSINALGHGLQSLGVQPGEVVSWQLPNWNEAYLLHHAVLRIGAVSNPIVPIYRAREVEYVLTEAGSKVVVVPETFRGFDHAAMVEQLRPVLPQLRHIVTVRPERSAPLSFTDLLAGEDAPVDVARRSEDPIVLMFTSGTTARPKGVIHSHDTFDYEDRSIAEVYGLSQADVVFMASPVTHVTGMLYGLQLPPLLGTTAVLQDIWDPSAALALIARHRCTFTVAATPFLHGLTYDPDLADHDLSSFRIFACGGADVPAGLVRTAAERLYCFVTRIYGSTEFPTLSTTGPNDYVAKAASTDGRPIGNATYRIVDEADSDLAVGEIGELLVKGPEALVGYLRPEDEIGAFTADGWFRTGDLASADADGYLTIRGRKKDIVLRGGENISVSEVEELLFDHPMVNEIAIVAMPDPVMVERACAFVVPSPGMSPTLDDLSEFLATRDIAKQKYPERLELLPALPKTQSGKVQKYLLRQQIRDLMGIR